MALQDDPYLECRVYGHAWKAASYLQVEHGLTEVELHCLRCPTIRRDPITASGVVYHRRYTYSPDYCYKADSRPSRQQFRTALLRRQRKNTQTKRSAKGA